MNLPQKVTKDFQTQLQIGKGWYMTEDGIVVQNITESPMSLLKNPKYYPINIEPTKNKYKMLEKEGLIVIDSITNIYYSSGGGKWFDYGYDAYWKVAPTENSKKYFVNNNEVIVSYKMFDKITGISEPDSDGIIKVNYDLKETNITPFGKFLDTKEQIISSTSNFKKYDDGWRIMN